MSLDEDWQDRSEEMDWEELDDPILHDASEAVVGQARLGTQQVTIDHTTAVIRSDVSMDVVLQDVLARRTSHSVVLGNALGGAPFVAHGFGPATSLPAPMRIEVDSTRIAVLVVNGGDRVYVQANPVASTARGRLAWVHVPGVAEFLRLPASQRTAQRNRWIASIRGAAVVNPATRRAFTDAELGALGAPVLRVLLAQHAAAALRVRTVRRGSARTDRGGAVRGVTLPMIRRPITEPQVYLRVISQVEGRMESINAWDAGAGISLGPIQINAQRAAIFRFLWSVWQADRTLFNATLGADWRMRDTAGHPELCVPVGGTPTWLHGRSANADVQRAIGYFHSGDPARPALSQIDPNHRRDLAGRFVRLIAWPHVQELLEDTTAWWLQNGLDQIHRAGIPALNAAAPDRDTFILKALLLSAYVRFSGCLAPLLRALRPFPTIAQKLANWERAVAAMDGPCRAGGNATQARRNANLLARLRRQLPQARRTFTEIRAVLATGATAPAAAPTTEWHESSLELSPSQAASLFDQIVSGQTRDLSEMGLRLVAGPGEMVPRQRSGDTWVLTRALGEGRFADLRRLEASADSTFPAHESGAPELAPGSSLGDDRILLEQAGQGVITRCGFFGPNAQRTEAQVRAAVVAAARAEEAHWHDAARRPRRESEAGVFGHLVRYYLSVLSRVRPDTLTAMQATAISGIAYAPIPGRGAANATVDRWAARVRGLVMAGAPGTNTPANIATQVEHSLKHARQARLDQGNMAAWSAVWVSSCVRSATINLGLEAMIQGNHAGRNELLEVSAAHRVYALEAHRRRVGPSSRRGTYHAFPPRDRVPQVGDIIVQDRGRRTRQSVLTYDRINVLSQGRTTHGDIVVAVAQGHVVTLGGNLSGGVRSRRYPLDANRRLVTTAGQRYAQENAQGILPAVPAPQNVPNQPNAVLPGLSTLRIFALLSPVEVCAAVPGQRYGGGILT